VAPNVSVSGGLTGMVRSILSDTNGRYTLYDMVTGPTLITVVTSQFNATVGGQQTVNIVAGQTASLDIIIGTSTVQTNVKNSDGTPAN